MSTSICYSNPVNALFNDFFTPSSSRVSRSAARALGYRPAIDVLEEEKTYKLYANLPGLSKEDVTITVEEGVLSIAGEKKALEAAEGNYHYFERSSGSFERKFNLPDGVDAEKVSAEMENGELCISIEKAEKVLPQKIDISVK